MKAQNQAVADYTERSKQPEEYGDTGLVVQLEVASVMQLRVGDIRRYVLYAFAGQIIRVYVEPGGAVLRIYGEAGTELKPQDDFDPFGEVSRHPLRIISMNLARERWIKDLPPYLGLGFLDPSSMYETSGMLKAKYKSGRETVYDVCVGAQRSEIVEYFASQELSWSTHRTLGQAFLFT
ncbi:MAG: hypothetical protein ACE5M4_01015 [Anaerolineales bacterium]